MAASRADRSPASDARAHTVASATPRGSGGSPLNDLGAPLLMWVKLPWTCGKRHSMASAAAVLGSAVCGWGGCRRGGRGARWRPGPGELLGLADQLAEPVDGALIGAQVPAVQSGLRLAERLGLLGQD